jgi:hypothetical protein
VRCAFIVSIVATAAKIGSENNMRSASTVVASTPCRYISFATMALAENSTAAISASQSPFTVAGVWVIVGRIVHRNPNVAHQ